VPVRTLALLLAVGLWFGAAGGAVAALAGHPSGHCNDLFCQCPADCPHHRHGGTAATEMRHHPGAHHAHHSGMRSGSREPGHMAAHATNSDTPCVGAADCDCGFSPAATVRADAAHKSL